MVIQMQIPNDHLPDDRSYTGE